MIQMEDSLVTKSRGTRMLTATCLGLAGLLLSGCAGTSPGVAIEVGDREISNSRVNESARHLCTALSEQLEAQSNTVPMSYVRQGVVQLLTIRAQAEQIAEEYGVEPGSGYANDRAQRETAASSLPEEAREDYVDLTSTQALYSDIVSQVGRIELERKGVEDPTVEQVTQAGNDVFSVWPDVHGVEVDPRYGLRNVDGQLTPVDTSLSVAVSDRAKSGSASEPDPAYARTLPLNHRCG